MAFLDWFWCLIGRHPRTTTKIIGLRRDRTVTLRKITVCVRCGAVIHNGQEIGKVKDRKSKK